MSGLDVFVKRHFADYVVLFRHDILDLELFLIDKLIGLATFAVEADCSVGFALVCRSNLLIELGNSLIEHRQLFGKLLHGSNIVRRQHLLLQFGSVCLYLVFLLGILLYLVFEIAKIGVESIDRLEHGTQTRPLLLSLLSLSRFLEKLLRHTIILASLFDLGLSFIASIAGFGIPGIVLVAYSAQDIVIGTLARELLGKLRNNLLIGRYYVLLILYILCDLVFLFILSRSKLELEILYRLAQCFVRVFLSLQSFFFFVDYALSLVDFGNGLIETLLKHGKLFLDTFETQLGILKSNFFLDHSVRCLDRCGRGFLK